MRIGPPFLLDLCLWSWGSSCMVTSMTDYWDWGVVASLGRGCTSVDFHLNASQVEDYHIVGHGENHISEP